MLNAHKEGALIVFEVDGRRCTFNLSSHETIGFSGKRVKSLNSQLNGYSVNDVIDAFDNDQYRKFLRFVSMKCSKSGVALTNPATVFSRLWMYSRYEQYYAAGIDHVDERIACALSEFPKPLVKYGREGGDITYTVFTRYRQNPNAIQAVLQSNDLENADKKNIIEHGSWYRHPSGTFLELVNTFGYNPTYLVRYIARLVRYEALASKEVMQNLYDYANMMSQVSPKYDKFPRNLLTTHQIASRNYNRLREQYDVAEFERARKPELEATIGEYVFIYPKDVDAIKDEAVQQNNCVASYVRSVLNGKCDIMFMRNRLNPEKSLVTLEVIDRRKIVQAYQRYNTPCTVEQRDAIKKWEELQEKRGEKTA